MNRRGFLGALIGFAVAAKAKLFGQEPPQPHGFRLVTPNGKPIELFSVDEAPSIDRRLMDLMAKAIKRIPKNGRLVTYLHPEAARMVRRAYCDRPKPKGRNRSRSARRRRR